MTAVGLYWLLTPSEHPSHYRGSTLGIFTALAFTIFRPPISSSLLVGCTECRCPCFSSLCTHTLTLCILASYVASVHHSVQAVIPLLKLKSDKDKIKHNHCWHVTYVTEQNKDQHQPCTASRARNIP